MADEASGKSTKEKGQKPFIARNVVQIQKMQLEKLMKDPVRFN